MFSYSSILCLRTYSGVTMKSKWIIGIFVVGLVIVAVSMLNLGDNIVYFYTPREAFAVGEKLRDKQVKIAGMVKVGTVSKDMPNMILKFTITDFKGHEIDVEHHGTPPDLFKEGQGVVAEGYFDITNKSMRSHRLMVKHSEEYRVPHDPESHDKQLLIKSILGD